MSNFKDVSSFGKLITYKQMTPDQIVVDCGVFDGVSQNQYGDLYNFTEVESGEKITIPKCGKLQYLRENGVLEQGSEYRLIYKGQGVVEKGAMAGKNFHEIAVLKNMDKEATTRAASKDFKETSSEVIDDGDDLLA